MATNRLIHETSPYLLQHAHNPVDWYAWGPEAFERARAEDKPIFLSVGYSTCYWCHVMERQCFENEAIAAEMNRRFVNIKVDREERPDVDQLYMTAVQVLTRHGGWPMSVFLTPDLRPFYGGTYFPPEDAHGRPGFVTVLRAIEDAYRNRRDEVNASADQLVEILRRVAEPPRPRAAIKIDDELIRQLIDRSVDDFDPVLGGFGGAPKFPRETLLELLLAYCDSPASAADPQSQIANRKSQILQMVRKTLDAMANGGIRDHLGGGFHRYSTDAKWLVPHFEIMLYDNAMLAYVYVEAYRQTGEPRYARIARGIFDFVLREMTSPEGAFYTAFDAEVDGREGLNYLWEPEEIESVLGADDAKFFNHVYGVDRGPNFADPHHGSGVADKNILYLARGPETEDDPRIVAMRQKLYAARSLRKQPLLDTKIITSWNALMIRALAHGGKILHEQRYIDAAARAADFLFKHHRRNDGSLVRTSRDGQAKYDGFLDDYAFLAQALLALRDAGGGEEWLSAARAIFSAMQARFGDEAGGFFFSAKDAADLIVRQKIASDSPLPSGNAVAAMVDLALSNDGTQARKTLSIFAEQLVQQAEGMSSMVQAALEYVRRHGPFTVQAAPQADQRPRSMDEIAASVVQPRAEWLDRQRLKLTLRIADGYHINAHEAASDLVPTTLRVLDDHATNVTDIEYPPAQTQRLAFADQPIPVYSGEVEILIRFSSTIDESSKLEVALSYQACDDSACLPPVTMKLTV